MALNKSELIGRVAERTSVTKAVVANVFDAFYEEVIEQLLTSGEVQIPRIGKLTTTTTPQRMARNPLTGEPVEVPAKRKVKFKPSGPFAKEVDYQR